MVKPKFTPDPPPHLQGMPVEKAFPLFVDWVIRQEYRIEDWWPKDYEERIQTLELLSPYCTGVWPIVDYGNITFSGEVTNPVVLSCPLTVNIIDNSTYSGGLADDAHYDPVRNKIYFSITNTLDNDGNLTVLDLSDDSITNYEFDISTRSGSWYGDHPTDGVGSKLWLTGWNPTIGSPPRYLRQIDLDSMTADWSVDCGLNEITLVAETNAKFFAYLNSGSLGYFRSFSKVGGGITDITYPAGYSDDSAQPASAVAINSTQLIIPARETSTGTIKLAIIAETATQVLVGDIVGNHPMESVAGVSTYTVQSRSYLIGGIVYMFSSDLTNTRKYISKVNTDGTLIENIYVDDDVNAGTTTWDVLSNTDVANYSSETNSFYWLESGYWHRWDLTTETTEYCVINVPTDRPIQYANGSFYHHDDVGGVGSARVFYRTN